MTTEENNPTAYPEYDENGKRNPIRVPITDESEQWEIDLVTEMQDYY